MVLATIKKLDQKNRTHIPRGYLKLVGIEENGNVVITVDSKTKQIIITGPEEECDGGGYEPENT